MTPLYFGTGFRKGLTWVWGTVTSQLFGVFSPDVFECFLVNCLLGLTHAYLPSFFQGDTFGLTPTPHPCWLSILHSEMSPHLGLHRKGLCQKGQEPAGGLQARTSQNCQQLLGDSGQKWRMMSQCVKTHRQETEPTFGCSWACHCHRGPPVIHRARQVFLLLKTKSSN